MLAARLAQQGVTGAADVLRSRFGFAQVFNARSEIAWDALQDWQGPQEIDSPYGINLKPYPSCAASHTAIEGALKIRELLQGDVDRIASLTVGAGRVAFSAMLYGIPETALQAKFSFPFCVAVALLEGKVDLGTFTLERIADPQVQRLMARIRVQDDERVREHSELGTVLTATLRDGTVLEEVVLIAAGKPERWFTRDRLQHKFDDCCGAVAATPAWRERAFDALQHLDSDQPLAHLLETLVLPGAAG